jgi:two-component system, NarL family, response regulator LiaR
MNTASTRTRALIIESQNLFAKGLAQILTTEAAFVVVGDAATLTEAALHSLRPDLILIDIDGDDSDLAESLRSTRAILPEVRICVMSMRLQPEVLQRCLTAGADGYVAKDVTPNEFLRAVKSVAAGESYVDPRIAGRLLRRRSQPNHSLSELSARETEVIGLIVAGMANKQISAKLNLSEKTVKNHVSRIFSKFDCTARTQAAVFAIRTGLV